MSCPWWCRLIGVLGMLMYFPRTCVYAGIVINEFSSGSSSDWIELYNTGTSSADLSAYRLKDASTNVKNLSGMLAAGGIISFSFSSWLNNTGDTVRLVSGDGSNEFITDKMEYGGNNGMCAPLENQSIGRLPDGWTDIKRFAVGSRDGTNNTGTEAPCPSPTLTPTPTAALLPTLTPTSTPQPAVTETPTPVATHTPMPTVKKTPTLRPTVPRVSDILGIQSNVTESLTATDSTGSDHEETEVPPEHGTHWLVFSLLFVGTGTGLLSAALAFMKTDIWNMHINQQKEHG